MPFDGLFMRRVIEEMGDIKGPLRNIYQTSKVDYYLQFQDGMVRLSLNPNHSFLSIVEGMRSEPMMPSSFTMLMRRRIRNARFEGIEQDGYSRVAVFGFRKLDEKGDLVSYRLFVELMGKHSNLILVNQDGMVVDAHRRITTRLGRELIPGRVFTPFKSPKGDPMSSDLVLEVSEIPVERLLVKLFEGMSTVLAREICHRAGISGKTAVELGPSDLNRLELALEDFRQEYSLGRSYLLMDGDRPVDVSPVKLNHTGLKHVEGSPSWALNTLYDHLEDLERFRQVRSNLERIVMREIEKVEDVLEKIDSELKEAQDYAKYRKWGELLLAYSHEVDPTSEEVELEDWESGEKVKVKVLPGKGAVGSAQRYFKIYEKLKRKREALERRKEDLVKELEYLYQLWQTLEDSEDLENLEEIKNEMVQAGLLKPGKREKARESKRSQPRRVVYQGFVILVGKNNVQNDELVREASPDDLWLHAREIPGAHVVVKTGGRDVPENVLRYAASLAAGYSKGKDSGRVPVDYTRIRYVRKPKGFKPGMVIYRNHKTVFVEPRRIH